MTLRTLLVAALAVAGLAAPPASAGQSSAFFGDCGIDSVNQKTVNGDHYQGAIYVFGALYSADPDDMPVSASVTCYVMVDGVPQPGTRVTMPATGAVAGAAVIDFEARDDQIVELCLEVDFLGDDTPTFRRGCGYGAYPPQIPPREVTDLLDLVFAYYEAVIGYGNDPVVEHVDPPLCALLVDKAGTYELVTIAPDGDVSVAGVGLWDCPPYGG